MATLYAIKCDECKQTIRETENVRESYAGGTCHACQSPTQRAYYRDVECAEDRVDRLAQRIAGLNPESRALLQKGLNLLLERDARPTSKTTVRLTSRGEQPPNC